MKCRKKVNVFLTIFLVIFLCFILIVPIILIPYLLNKDYRLYSNMPKDATFIELWEVDTFEGGSFSRARFLEKTAYKFQELNKMVYIFVRTLTYDQTILMLQEGEMPDMISFGVGLGDKIVSLCKNLDINTTVRTELLQGGMSNNEPKAIPWCIGGYMLATQKDIDLDNDISKYIIGCGGEYNIYSKAINNFNTINKKVYATQYKAYENFIVGNNFDILLGTQRDYYRLKNKLDLGVISSCNFKFVSVYSDLLQYISVFNDDSCIYNCCCAFIKYLLSATIQKTLSSIAMFGTTNIKIYNEGGYNDFENVLIQDISTINVFTSEVELNEFRYGE